MASANLNGIDIYYELHGQGEPLVLIAGFSCDHLFWTGMLDELSKHFQVLIFDNRAIGRTKDSGNSFTLETMADDTLALIKHLELKRPHIVGHSMGGMVAQIISRKYPHEINKQIILNSTTKINFASIMVIQGTINFFKDNVPIEHVIDASLPWFYSSQFLANPKNVAALKALIVNNPFPQSITDFERQYHALKSANTEAWLHEIKSTTLVVVSENDIVIFPAESKIIHHKIPGATLAIIPGGHSSPVERPQQVNNAIIKFLAAPPSS